MPSSFPRTLGRLDTEARGPRPAAIAVTGLLLAMWTAWFFGARVVLYAVSDTARLEVDASPYPVEAPVDGRVVSTALAMGREVRAGDVLVELDVRAQNLSVGEEQSKIAGVARQIERLLAEMAEERNSRRAEEAAAAVAQQEARARHAEAIAASDFAANAEQRTRALADKGLIGQAELIRAESEEKQKRAAAEALRLTAERLVAEQLHRETAHRIAVERLEGEIAVLRAQQQTGSLTVERLQHEGALRQIVAPVSGTLAEVATLAVGRVLQPGQAVATIVPAGGLRIVAGFAPAEAFGRVHEGQSARLRLEGFPPTQYGSIQAVVSTVARELREGVVRVELALAPATNTSVPIQHGTPGTVEVEVERISPAALVLRAVGRRMSPQSPSGRP
jgi:membrane fusion protein (multidrug efflux system)